MLSLEAFDGLNQGSEGQNRDHHAGVMGYPFHQRCSEIWSKNGKHLWLQISSHNIHKLLYKMFASVFLVYLTTGKKIAHQTCVWPRFPSVFRREADIKGVCKACATPQTAWYPAAPAWEYQESGNGGGDNVEVDRLVHKPLE